MTDRYAAIHAAEDLGGLEMFPDRTAEPRPDDLNYENAPSVGGHRPEGFVPNSSRQEGAERS